MKNLSTGYGKFNHTWRDRVVYEVGGGTDRAAESHEAPKTTADNIKKCVEKIDKVDDPDIKEALQKLIEEQGESCLEDLAELLGTLVLTEALLQYQADKINEKFGTNGLIPAAGEGPNAISKGTLLKMYLNPDKINVTHTFKYTDQYAFDFDGGRYIGSKKGNELIIHAEGAPMPVPTTPEDVMPDVAYPGGSPDFDESAPEGSEMTAEKLFNAIISKASEGPVNDMLANPGEIKNIKTIMAEKTPGGAVIYSLEFRGESYIATKEKGVLSISEDKINHTFNKAA